MTVADGVFHASSLLGPTGGALGIAFGAGAAAGWHFAQRTVLKLTTRRFDDLAEKAERDQNECRNRIAVLEAELNSFKERYLSGLERQLSQVRESTAQLVSDGRIRPVGAD